jgi:hypothetical protein
LHFPLSFEQFEDFTLLQRQSAQYPTSIDPGCMPSHLVTSHFLVVPLRSFDDVGFGGAEII